MLQLAKILGIALLMSASILAQSIMKPCDRIIAERSLRKTFVTKLVPPIYPKDAIREHVTGIAVAEVCVPPGSSTALIRIVAAPSEAVRKSMEDALRQWTFGPMWAPGDPSHLYSYASKVIYYFVERQGESLVLGSDDSFYVGPRFAVKEQVSHH